MHTEISDAHVELVVRVRAVWCPQCTVRLTGEGVSGTRGSREDVSDVRPGSPIGRCANLNTGTSCFELLSEISHGRLGMTEKTYRRRSICQMSPCTTSDHEL